MCHNLQIRCILFATEGSCPAGRGGIACVDLAMQKDCQRRHEACTQRVLRFVPDLSEFDISINVLCTGAFT